VQPHHTGAGFRTSEKMQCSKPSLSGDLHRCSGTHVEQLDYLDGARAVCHPLPFMPSRALKANPVRT
jgi:hypothetical protein